MYFNMLKCFEISLPVVALQRRHWRQHVVRWLVECNGSLSYTDATWTDGNEVSVLSLRCAETFAQLGMGWRSPLVFSCYDFPWYKHPFCSVHACGDGECGCSEWLICVHIWKYTRWWGAHGLYMYSCLFKTLPVREALCALWAWEAGVLRRPRELIAPRHKKTLANRQNTSEG